MTELAGTVERSTRVEARDRPMIAPDRHCARVLLLIATLALPAPSIGAAGEAAPPAAPDIDWGLTPTQLESECVAVTAQAFTRIDAIAGAAGEDRPDLERLLEIEATLAVMDEALVAHTALAAFATDPELREKAGACRAAVERLGVNVAAHPGIYAIAGGAAAAAGDPVDRQLARVYLESGRRAGAHLPPETRGEITGLMRELSQVQLDFQRALSADRTSIEISQAEAGSLPPGMQMALRSTETGYVVPVTYGAVNREFLARMADGAVRERYQVAFLNRGGEDNLERVRRAVELRREIARLAGYSSWAQYRLDTLMAGDPDRAMDLVRTVNRALLEKAGDEMAALEALKRDGGDTTPFAAWDYGYYQPLLERERYGVDDAEVRRYFPVATVVPRVLDIYAELFGLHFERVPAGDDAWAPGVSLYAISEAIDEDGPGARPFAFFYIDLEPREGKFLSPSSYPLRAGRRLSGDGYRRPVAAIVGNGPQARPGEPALFSHAGLVQFFHEFGHIMHMTLSTAPYATLHGSNTRRDFVEAPSQMLENWVWQPGILQRLSSHVETGEPLPPETIRRMTGLKRASTGVFWTRQAFLATWDLTLHGPTAEAAANPLWFELMPRLTPLPPTPGTMPPASFMPVMGGYDATYYAYLWSRVYAQDMFSVFMQEGIDNPTVGRRFRERVLEPGGTQEPDALFRAFTGRPVSYDAFFEELGVDRGATSDQ